MYYNFLLLFICFGPSKEQTDIAWKAAFSKAAGVYRENSYLNLNSTVLITVRL